MLQCGLLVVVVFDEVFQEVRVDVVLDKVPHAARALLYPHVSNTRHLQYVRPERFILLGCVNPDIFPKLHSSIQNCGLILNAEWSKSVGFTTLPV